ncbi:MAG: D-alanyl-D-alanine carboxypeptidase/D-alanyl-D-alanine-endopeptidase [Pseudomonadota bacterium]
MQRMTMLTRRPLVYLLCLFSISLQAAEAPVVQPDQAELPLPVRNVLAHRQLPMDTLSLFVFNLDEGSIELSLNPDTPRNPASVMKLVTTLVALDELGPAYRWQTEAWAVGEVNDDSLAGDLLLKGYGDPFLVTERVWQMLRELRMTGLRSIEGDLLIDDSYFDMSDYDPAAFDRQPLRAYNVAPNALMMNFKVVRYRFEPEPGANGVLIRMDPELDNLKVVNRLSVQDGSCRGYQRGIAIIPNDSYNEFTFSGRFPRGCNQYSMTRAALGHNEFTYGMFRSMWQEVGGEFEGNWRNVVFEPADDQEPLLVFESQPLADVISRVNKYSNNVMARHLLLTVAAERFGAPGTEQNGRKSVRDWMTERGFDAAAVELTNGAGLSRSARITARQLADMLRFAYEQPYMPEFLSSMSLSGLDGTTTRRFDERDQLAGQAHVKTGRLDHVSAIAGFIQSQSGARHIVVTLHNHNDVHRGYGAEVQEALLRWVFSR